MPHERLRPSFVFDEEKIEHLRQIAPEAFADGKINWEVLKQALGEQLEEEDANAEHFGLFWPGKREARKIASIPSKGTLIPITGEGVNEETTKNVFIEGENLEVLKLLQKSYASKIKMIYIDPPYNTGNDFVYDDSFIEPLDEYLKYTGQMDEEGKLLTTNKKADGRFHSKWLSMMYPRLRLARNLLSNDGVIFISIDDNENIHLKKICDEVFGEENFIAQLVWRKKAGGGSDSKYFAIEYEYILCYLKDAGTLISFDIPYSEKEQERFSLEDKKGKYYLKTLERPERLGPRPNLRYPIISPDNTKIEFKENGKKYTWVVSQTRFDEMKNNDEIVFNKTRDGSWRVYRKVYMETQTPRGLLYDLILNRDATAEMKQIFNNTEIFSNPKPSALIKYLIHIATNQESSGIVLDFFAGSCTMAHSVFLSNIEDKGLRQFIAIQMEEIVDKDSEAFKAGYENIAEIGKDRIRKVIKIINTENDGKLKGLDIGFKVFKLVKSNFKQWQDYKGKDPKELTSLFKEHEIPLIDGWKSDHLLTEIMLQEGFPLDSEITALKEYKKNDAIQVKSEFCEHKLLVCFDKKIYQETIDALDIKGEDIFVCLDSALSDEQKITLSDKGFLKTI